MLLLALHCPGLALKVFAGLVQTMPMVVVERDGVREPLIACNEAACAVGLGPGMTLGAVRPTSPACEC